MIVVSLVVSTSQTLVIVLAVFSLLVCSALLWMNQQARPILLPEQAGAVCPVDLVSRASQTFALQLPARAPPTFNLPSNFVTRHAVSHAPDSPARLMDRHALDSADDLR